MLIRDSLYLFDLSTSLLVDMTPDILVCVFFFCTFYIKEILGPYSIESFLNHFGVSTHFNFYPVFCSVIPSVTYRNDCSLHIQPGASTHMFTMLLIYLTENFSTIHENTHTTQSALLSRILCEVTIHTSFGHTELSFMVTATGVFSLLRIKANIFHRD